LHERILAVQAAVVTRLWDWQKYCVTTEAVLNDPHGQRVDILCRNQSKAILLGRSRVRTRATAHGLNRFICGTEKRA
jgi:hypothetical protein